MPADTITPILGLLLQGTGNNNNTWGVNLNNSVITPLENAVKNANQLTLSGGAYTLTQANAAYASIILIGTLSSDVTITVPSVASKWSFLNACSGAFAVSVKSASGNLVNLPNGAKVTDVMTNGFTCWRQDGHLVGEYFFHAGYNPPPGALECNGAAVSRTQYSDLFAQLGTLHGVGNGTSTFNLPDGTTNGRFLRSRSGSVGVGTVQGSANLNHTHTGGGTVTTGGVSANHTHDYSGSTGFMDRANPHSHGVSAGVKGGTLNAGLQAGGSNIGPVNTGGASGDITINNADINHAHGFAGTTGFMSGDHSHSFTYSFTTSLGSADGAEARPNNISGVLCIRY